MLKLASNDYLSLAGDPSVARAAAAALDEFGNGRRARRGSSLATIAPHATLERGCRLASSHGRALLRQRLRANVGVITTLLGPEDVIYSDELNHASIIDGCRLSRAEIVVYPHLDLAALERRSPSHGARRRIVVSETLFSMDGDLADVAALCSVARRHDAALILDEAHAVGVRGPEGRGVAAGGWNHAGRALGTCGKALGSFRRVCRLVAARWPICSGIARARSCSRRVCLR